MAKAKKQATRKARTVRDGGGPGLETTVLRIIVGLIALVIALAGAAYLLVPRVMM